MISSYTIDDVTIIKYAGVDDYNEPIATSEVDVKGYIEYKTRLLTDLTGQQVVAGTKGAVTASAKISLAKSIDVPLGRALRHEDRLKFNSIEHRILKIDEPKAFSSPHYEVWVA